MSAPLFSSFAGSGVVDSLMNLRHGSMQITTTLAADLAIDETDKILVVDAGLAETSGTVIIDDEIIFYHVYDQREPGCVSDLLRGQLDSSPASHTTGAVVSIVSAPRFANPAVAESLIATQEMLLAVPPIRRGTIIVVSASTMGVLFASEMPGADYSVAFGPLSNLAVTIWASSKTTSGFTLNLSASASGSIDYIAIG